MKLLLNQPMSSNQYNIVQRQIKDIHDNFEKLLAKYNNLIWVMAPLVVSSNECINDLLNGIEKPVTFKVNDLNEEVEIIQSLAKWKRTALKKYGFKLHEGLYTNMKAIRKDETLDATHSIYVDQWDWEVIIDKHERNLETLKKYASKIYDAIIKTQSIINQKYHLKLNINFPQQLTFIEADELAKQYPNLSASERETKICQKFKAVFIIGIGKKLSDGSIHDKRSPDYDDWSLNGDLIVWSDAIKGPLELSSMGIRVNNTSLKNQLIETNLTQRLNFAYHKDILKSKLPQTIGGGIGQSRVCMFILQKKHIGEVQCSVWSKKQLKKYKKLSLL